MQQHLLTLALALLVIAICLHLVLRVSGLVRRYLHSEFAALELEVQALEDENEQLRRRLSELEPFPPSGRCLVCRERPAVAWADGVACCDECSGQPA